MLSRSSNSNRCNPITCCVAIVVVISLAFNIAAIVVATQHADDPCQSPDKSHVSLHGWLLVSGIVGLCVSVLTTTAFCGYLVFDWESCLVPYVGIIMLNFGFVFAWFILGIVIIARSNASCVDDSTPLGVMSVIMLVIQGLGICGVKSQASNNTN